MRIIAKRTLRDFWEQPAYREAEAPLKTWYSEVHHATWRTPADVKAHYGSASLLPNDRVVFNIGGNKYRLIVLIRYRSSPNTRVTSRQLTRHGCDLPLCQIGFPIFHSRNRHKINGWFLHYALPNRL